MELVVPKIGELKTPIGKYERSLYQNIFPNTCSIVVATEVEEHVTTWGGGIKWANVPRDYGFSLKIPHYRVSPLNHLKNLMIMRRS